MSNLPLVSCLCITKNDLQVLKRSIACFQAQSYVDKELIIVKQGNNEEVRLYLEGLDDDNITYLQLPDFPKQTLGELRNISIQKSNGEYFCTWDDDDWQHKDRLKIQLELTLQSSFSASILTNILAFDQPSKKVYLTARRTWEATVICKKELFINGIRYPSLSKKEDTAFSNLIIKNTSILPIEITALYIYIYHGMNTWDLNHFNTNIFRYQLSSKASKIISNIMFDPINCIEASKMIDDSTISEEIRHYYTKK